MKKIIFQKSYIKI